MRHLLVLLRVFYYLACALVVLSCAYEVFNASRHGLVLSISTSAISVLAIAALCMKCLCMALDELADYLNSLQ